MHVHMCICVSFILALALSGVTSAPYAAPGLTQYAHTDEDHPRPELLESQRCKCHTHTHAHTHTHSLYLYNILFYIPCLLFLLFLSSPISKACAVCALTVCDLLVNVYVLYDSLSGGDSRLHWPPSPCLAFPIFDSSKGCSGHSIIGTLSDFLFVMITQNNKSAITFFVQSELGDRK